MPIINDDALCVLVSLLQHDESDDVLERERVSENVDEISLF